jgi:hypothetical protein
MNNGGGSVGVSTGNGGVHGNLTVANADNAWLWWLIMAFGLLICVRAIVQYLRIKKSWMGLSTAARERLFFFY